MNSLFTGIFRPETVAASFPVLSEKPITSGPWSWTSQKSEIFASADGWQILFAGLIENRHELLTNLHLSGNTSDANLALQLYLSKKDKFALQIQGSYCFAILNYAKGQLILGRDMLGRDSLFYTKTANGMIAFSNALQDLRKIQGVSTEMDPEALTEYLSLGYISAPRTIFKNVYKLEAATMIHIQANGTSQEQRYWSPEFMPKYTGSFSDALTEGDTLITQAIKRCFDSQKKIGFFLSGGWDSNLLLAYSKQFQTGTPQAINISFENSSYDEASLASLTAAKFGVHLEIIKAKPDDLHHLIDSIGDTGEPFADSSLLPLTLACQKAPTDMQAVFTGDGGDEMFGGYRRYQAMQWRKIFSRQPMRSILSFIQTWQESKQIPIEQRSTKATMYRFINAMTMNPADAYLSFQGIFSRNMLKELYKDSSLAENNDSAQKLFNSTNVSNICERCMAFDVLRYLPYDGLRKGELADQQRGLDIYSPFLSRPVVEFMLHLPRSYKSTIFQRKRIIRTLGKAVLPAELMQQGKRGFGVPLADWMRTVWSDDLRNIENDLSQWDTKGWFDSNAIHKLVSEHLQNQNDHSSRLWNLLCLKNWLKNL
ncbi:MAG: asparagine synthase-related protein [Lentisphaeria bacterium]